MGKGTGDDFTRFAAGGDDLRRLMDRQAKLRKQGRRPGGDQDQAGRVPKHKGGDRFVRGPVPLAWLTSALAFGGKAGNVAWAVWFLAGLGGNPVRLTKRVLCDFRVSPRVARRVLNQWEQAGLVGVDRQRGRGPDVLLRWPDEIEKQRDTALEGGPP